MAITTYKTKTGHVRFRATIWQRNRPVKSQSFARKVDAKDWERRQKVQFDDSKIGRLKGEKMTLREFFHQVYWPNKRIREGTAKDYMRVFVAHLDPKFGHKPLTQTNEDEWSMFLSSLVNKGMEKARANRIHAVASAIFKMAFKFRYVQSNPLTRVDWFEEDLHDFNYWSFSEAEQFLNWAFVVQNSRFALYQTAYETGLRISELQALQRDCVDLINGTILVRRAYCRITKKVVQTTKGSKKRVLGLNQGLIAVLQKHWASHSNQFVFCGEKTDVFHYDSLFYQFETDQSKAQVRKISFHDIRHTFASHYVMSGGNIYDLKELLGHGQIETTMRYAHLSPGHLKEKAALVSFKAPTPKNVVSLNLNSPEHFPNIEGQKIEKAPSAPSLKKPKCEGD